MDSGGNGRKTNPRQNTENSCSAAASISVVDKRWVSKLKPRHSLGAKTKFCDIYLHTAAVKGLHLIQVAVLRPQGWCFAPSKLTGTSGDGGDAVGPGQSTLIQCDIPAVQHVTRVLWATQVSAATNPLFTYTPFYSFLKEDHCLVASKTEATNTYWPWLRWPSELSERPHNWFGLASRWWSQAWFFVSARDFSFQSCYSFIRFSFWE